MKHTTFFNSVIEQAAFWAAQFGSSTVEPEHFVYAIIRIPNCKAYQLLVKAGVDIDRMDAYLHSLALNEPTRDLPTMSRACERLLRLAAIEADDCNDSEINTVHLLLSVLRERIHKPTTYLQANYNLNYEKMVELYTKLTQKSVSKSAKGLDLSKLGLDKMLGLDKIDPGKMISMQIIGANPFMSHGMEDMEPDAAPTNAEAKNPFYHQWTKEQLESTRLCGRQDTIDRMLHIMNRLLQNNPLLVGVPGVGRYSIIQLLMYQHLVKGKYSEIGSVYELDYTALVAGASYKGQFEMRLKSVIDTLKAQKNSILVIQNLQMLMDGGRGQNSFFDGASMIKEALQAGYFRCIATTTPQAYSHWIEPDSGFASLFQTIRVEPPTEQEALEMLDYTKHRFEIHHHVHYSEAALRACVQLSERYMTNEVLPVKALVVMDETGVLHHLSRRSRKPATEITEAHVAQAVSIITGVPMEQVQSSELERVVNMEQRLNQQVLGQEEAIHRLTRAIVRSRMGLRDPKRPIGSFFFLGSTGVGKTYLAQCLAEQLFGSRDALIRIDMSEYKEKHTISLLVGAPPGYVGYENGGKLTEAVKQHPYSIVLLDEIEKAHPDVFNLLLQVLDEGRLTDRQGRFVDFRNTIIIMTSNVGTRQLSEFGAGIGFDVAEMTANYAVQTLRKALDKTFPPEFINRVDDIITFAPLSKPILAQILCKEIALLQERMQAQNRQLVVSAQAEQQLFDQAYDPKNGARPIRRAIQTYLEEVIIQQIMDNPMIEKIKINKI